MQAAKPKWKACGGNTEAWRAALLSGWPVSGTPFSSLSGRRRRSSLPSCRWSDEEALSLKYLVF